VALGRIPELHPTSVNLSQRREVQLGIYPRGTKTAWYEVLGKKRKDASSPLGTIDQGFLQMRHSPFLGLGRTKETEKNNVL
jgi:hypothetical protein